MTELLKSSASKSRSAGSGLPAHQSTYEDLRDLILFGDLAPGDAVTIQGLCDRLGAGVTPVRETIRRLTSEGALKMLGNRRVIVPEMTEDDVEQLDFLRKSIEPELSARACGRITPNDLLLLETHDSALNTAIRKGDIAAYLACNHKFHMTLYGVSGAPILLETVNRLWLRFGPSLRVVCGRFGTLNLPDKHADLINALRSQSIEGARAATFEDIDQGMCQIKAALQGHVTAKRFDRHKII